MKRHGISFFCAAVLCAATVLLSACGSGSGDVDASPAGDGSVMLSNIRTADSQLSSDERKMLKAVQDCIEKAYITNDDTTYGYNISMENTTPYVIDGSLYFNLYDGDGRLIDTGSTSLSGGLESKGKIFLPTYLDQNIGEDCRVTVQAEYIYGASYYRTAAVHLTINRAGGSAANVKLWKSLPLTVETSSSKSTSEYTVTDFRYDAETVDYYNILLTVTKESGERYSDDPVRYKVVGDDGVIYFDEYFYISYLRSGDTALIPLHCIDLPAGNYTLELSQREF